MGTRSTAHLGRMSPVLRCLRHGDPKSCPAKIKIGLDERDALGKGSQKKHRPHAPIRCRESRYLRQQRCSH